MESSPQQPMRRLFRYLGSYKPELWFSSLSAVTNKVFDLMPPFLTAWVIDSVSGNPPLWITGNMNLMEPSRIVVFLGILAALIFFFESFFEWLFQRGFMRLAQRVQHDLRIQAYDKLQRREAAFFEEQRTGNLMSILNDDINQLERFLNASFSEILHLATLFIFASISLFMVSPKLALIGIIPLPFIFFGSMYYQKIVSPLYLRIRTAVGELSSRLENNISGIMVIKSFTAERMEYQRVKEVSKRYRDANFKSIRYNSLYVPAIRIFITVGFVSVLVVGGFMIINDTGEITVGGLAFFSMMIQRLLWPVTRLGRVFDEFERAKASARRVFGIMDGQSLITDGDSNASVVDGYIQLENIGFKYQNGQQVFQGVTLDIPAGNTVGIAGPTGAGKTTLIKLLLRLYDVSSGTIRIDGTDIRDMKLNDLRHQVALVSQDVYLFHGSIRENISYGMAYKREEEIVAAAKKAELHNFIMSLENGYDSIVGERGIKLSGGQRQRLSIARAVLKDAPILILDEATSAVDTETERAIQRNLDQLTEGKTALIIAHRLSTIRRADQIIVLKDGGLAELGSHDELLALDGAYAELWNVQIGVG